MGKGEEAEDADDAQKTIRWRVVNVAEYQLEDDYFGEDEEAEEDEDNEIEDFDINGKEEYITTEDRSSEGA